MDEDEAVSDKDLVTDAEVVCDRDRDDEIDELELTVEEGDCVSVIVGVSVSDGVALGVTDCVSEREREADSDGV